MCNINLNINWTSKLERVHNLSSYNNNHTIYLINLRHSTYRVTVVSPRTKLHKTSLLVEGKIFHVDLAKWFIDCRWLPHDLPRMMQNRLSHNGYLIITIGTENKKNWHFKYLSLNNLDIINNYKISVIWIRIFILTH